ncbi:MAG: metallophosphoesterase family protein [Candidatus Nanoarchaeia archaeon]
MKFAHLADCHLGSWRQESLQKLNFQSFQQALQTCIQEEVEFILIAGDLFDSAYPPIEILKETFAEFKKVKDANIPVYLIAGSHDFSASGKTFLDVLEKAGFCINVEQAEEQDGKIKLKPYMHNNIAIFGYSGKKSGMEIQDLQKVDFSPQTASIFMLHTTIKDVVGNIPMEYLEKEKLPLADYYAFGHIHKVFKKTEANASYVYPGPIFPNNFQELADLRQGSFCIVEWNNKIEVKHVKIKLKDVEYLELDITNALTATEQIIEAINKLNLNDKIFLLKLKGKLEQGKTGDIRFNEIEDFVKKKQAYAFLRSISSLEARETEIQSGLEDLENMEHIEEKIIEDYNKNNPADFNKYLPQLMNALSIEKNEDEKSTIFENRLIDDLKKVLQIDLK